MLNTVAAGGYFLVGVLFLVLVALLATSWRSSRAGIYLIVVCLINAAWGFALAWNQSQSSVEPVAIFVLEVLRPTTWVVFLAYLAAQIGVNQFIRRASVILCLAVLVAGTAVWVHDQRYFASFSLGSILFPGGLAIALTGLLLIEQVYRNTPAEGRWALKPLVLGLGGMFTYDLFLYSQAVLFSALDPATWTARGVINLFFVPAIAVAARRNPDWKLRIFVSRHVVFYTTTLVAVGAYLIVMSLGGYLLIRFGGSWGVVARVVFFAGAIMVLLVLLFSTTLRARLRVFLNKHFFHNKYDYREEWMRLIDTLAEFEESSTREVAVKAVAQIVNSPSGVVWLFSESENQFLLDSRFEFEQELPDLDVNDSLIAFIRRDKWVVDLFEFSCDPEMYEGLALPEWIRPVTNAWLFVPLVFGQELIGLIMLTKAPGPPKLNYEDRDLLKTVGNHVAVHLAEARSERLLAEAQQFDAYNKLTAFLMHDLNNLIAQQSLIVSNAEKHKRNPEFVDDAISTIAGSVERMKAVMDQLKRGKGRALSKPVQLKFLASAAVDRCLNREPQPRLELNDEDVLVNANADEFIMVLTHLVRNAQDATEKDGDVTVKLQSDAEFARIIVKDGGTGMSQQFIREKLFRPFQSTKGSEGMGIGAYQAREFARSHGGDVIATSVAGEGTEMTLFVPRFHSRA